MNKIASLRDSVIHIDNLENIEYKKEELKCVECGSMLIPKRGFKNQWHFAHKNKENCYYNGEMKEGYKTKGGESAVHKICKEIILNGKSLIVPVGNDYKEMKFKECIVEYEYDNKKIDVVGFTDTGKKVAIEIFYKHRVDDQKLNVLRKGFDYIIEICIEDSYFSTYKELVKEVICGSNKRWLYLNKNTDIRIKSGFLSLEHEKGLLEHEKEKLRKSKEYYECEYNEFNSWLIQKQLFIKEYEEELKRKEQHLKNREELIDKCEGIINKHDLISQYEREQKKKWWEENSEGEII